MTSEVGGIPGECDIPGAKFQKVGDQLCHCYQEIEKNEFYAQMDLLCGGN